MSQIKQPSKRKRRSKAVPVLEAAGLLLSLASTASAVPGGPAINLSAPGSGDGNQVILDEEEIADMSLGTFYVFDKECDGRAPLVQLVGHGCHGCYDSAKAEYGGKGTSQGAGCGAEAKGQV